MVTPDFESRPAAGRRYVASSNNRKYWSLDIPAVFKLFLMIETGTSW
jgi:hypothetical protein